MIFESQRARSSDGKRRSEPCTPPPTVVHEVLGTSGQPLDQATRAFMERRFGFNFERVRVHVDEKAAESARALHANAYTVGSHIVFRTGKYLPDSSRGQKLIAHELAHVVQQTVSQERPRGGSVSETVPTLLSQFSSAEAEAKVLSETIMSHRMGAPLADSLSAATHGVQRDAASEYFSRGYLDGESGFPYQPGPLDTDALKDYEEGYLKGRNEFLRQSKLAAPSASSHPQSATSEQKKRREGAKKGDSDLKQTAIDLAKSKALAAAGAAVGKAVAEEGAAVGAAKLGGVYGLAVDFATSPGGDVQEKYSGYRAVEMQGEISVPLGDVHIKRENAEKDAAAYSQRTGGKATIQQVILADPSVAVE
jgi:Domain of unknown function (DUF4157)